MTLLHSLVQLDPAQRAVVVARHAVCDEGIDREAVVRECIPAALLPPLYLSSSSLEDEHDTASAHDDWPVERLVATAQTRRTYLSTLEDDW
jgi:hypothetical protein